MQQAQRQPGGQMPDAFVPITEARSLLGRDGAPIHRQTVFALGVCREIDVRKINGRYCVERESIEAYRRRHNIG